MSRDAAHSGPSKATGLPPYQYEILCRVERGRQLLQAETGLSLAEVAAHARFSDQSAFCFHFKRIIGVTPGQLQIPARITKLPARPAKKPLSDPLIIPHE
jgi:AraC-like DNA-binding protein